MNHLLLTIPFFFAAIIIHEFSHGWMAYKLGDPTAKYSGRLTLNPLAHIDPFGTILLPLLLLFLNSPVIFGWAKPVPINFWNLRHPKRDMVLVGIAGPLANFILAFLLSLFLKLNLSSAISIWLSSIILVNLVLGVFNLIPIPPLDGSRIISGIMPARLAIVYNQLERYGVIIIFLLLFTGVFDRLVWPFINILGKLLGINLNV
ncbi:MAG: site-2 protease family protein [Candidatus Omnitrophota bacterium]|nr:site-2 protease family protein [Candidatus Omnitrophota bacterium]